MVWRVMLSVLCTKYARFPKMVMCNYHYKDNRYILKLCSLHPIISDPPLPTICDYNTQYNGLIIVADVVSQKIPLLGLWLLCSCQMIREALQNDIAVMQKSSPVDLVTETDQKVEQLIISSIKEKYPTHRYFTS